MYRTDHSTSRAARVPAGVDRGAESVTGGSDRVTGEDALASAANVRSRQLRSVDDVPRRADDGVHVRRVVLRYGYPGPLPAVDVTRITGEVRVLDRSARMLLVEASDQQLVRLARALPRWIVAEEQEFRLTGTGSARSA